jgi:chromosome partitioning protein
MSTAGTSTKAADPASTTALSRTYLVLSSAKADVAVGEQIQKVRAALVLSPCVKSNPLKELDTVALAECSGFIVVVSAHAAKEQRVGLQLRVILEHLKVSPRSLQLVAVDDTRPEALHPALKNMPVSRPDWSLLLKDFHREVRLMERRHKVIMFISLKGGVSKTTTAVAVAEALASNGHRTLVIDADHQQGSSFSLLGQARLDDQEKRGRTLPDLIRETVKAGFSTSQMGDYIVTHASSIGPGLEHLSVLPCSLRIEDLLSNIKKANPSDPEDKKRMQDTNATWRFLCDRRVPQLRDWLKVNYDFVIIDCPPAIAIQVRLLMMVADAYVVPSIPDQLSVRGARYLRSRVSSIQIKIAELGALWSMVRQITSHLDTIKYYQTQGIRELPQVFETQIPHANTMSHSDSLLHELERHKTFKEKYGVFHALYTSLANEIIFRTI